VTCIVGLVDQGHVFIGTDSAGVSNYDLTVRADSKVFQNGPFLIGFTTSFRMGQLLRYAFEPPAWEPGSDVPCYLATTFVDAVRKCLSEGGYAVKHDEQESGGRFLVGFRGCLYAIGNDYQVGQSVVPYNAIGCGAPYALGALYVTGGMDAKERIQGALSAAEHFSTVVQRSFIIKELERDLSQS